MSHAVEQISDPADPRLADYAHIGDPGWLRDRDLFVAEGRLVVERLAGAGRFRIRSMLLTPTTQHALAERMATPPCPVFLASRQIMETITGFSFHQGCLALAERGPALPLSSLDAGRWMLGIEGVGNPDNVGGLFRTADAFGMDGVLLDAGSGDPLYRKAIRASMGAALRLPFVTSDAFADALAALRRTVTLVALTPRSPSLAVEDYRRTRAADGGTLLLVGAEGPGLSAQVLSLADVRVSIPLIHGVDSLNVVVAAGIAMAALRPV